MNANQHGRRTVFLAATLCLLIPPRLQGAAARPYRIDVNNEQGEPLPCRIHLADENGRAVQIDGLPFWKDHFVCPGAVSTELPNGSYSFEIERGPEYERKRGRFTVGGDAPARVAVTLKRIADLASRGWWSGDLHVHRKPDEIELLMQAEDLHVAPIITWWNNNNRWSSQRLPENPLRQFDENRFYHLMAGEDERAGGALMFFNLPQPLDITTQSQEHPSPVRFLTEAKQHDSAWVDIEKPFWWDVPTWLATGKVDSIGLANNHMCRSEMYESEAWGRRRDEKRLPPPLGNGYWSQDLYYHVLNTGLRIPPSAGSASGVLPNPVGYNRVYVHAGNELTYDDWWRGLRAGRCFVTNGPLLLCRANGEVPGHVFSSSEGPIELDIHIELIGNDSVPAIEIIQDGQVVRTIRCEPGAVTQKLTTQLAFGQSGWFLIRAIAENSKTFRFASTAPYYVEIGPTRRQISRKSSSFFRDWVDERMRQIDLEDTTQLRDVLKYHHQAREFWAKRVEVANAK